LVKGIRCTDIYFNTMERKSEVKQKFSLLHILVIILSLYVLGALFIDTVFEIPEETSLLLMYIDNAVCAIFFVEFCIRFYYAENKWKFMKWGWIDLVSSIPMVDFLRAGRLLRLIRLLRIIRAFKSTKELLDYLFRDKAKGVFTSVSVLAVLLIIFSSIAILQVETLPQSNIKTAEDALWWAYVTITTVGYGDKYPITTEGRIIAAVLMTAGVGLFGTFTAVIASWFVGDKKKEEQE
jgi:voltage-gated potassium channel